MFNGEVRNFIVILLLLNQPSRIQMTQVSRTHGLRRGRRVVYAAHSIVELELGRMRDYRRLCAHYPTDRASPRRHEVRGHLTHLGGRKTGCAHTWPEVPTASATGVPTWTCTTCGRVRRWKRAHQRGDATRGFTTKEYEINT